MSTVAILVCASAGTLKKASNETVKMVVRKISWEYQSRFRG